MGDPILDAHQVVPGFFVISGPLAPISIRDQMIRGQLLVERLLEKRTIVPTGNIGPDSKFGVVIVGAGAAGVTAAITAANNMRNTSSSVDNLSMRRTPSVAGFSNKPLDMRFRVS